MSLQRQSGWGHPVGVKAAADWANCPSLAPFPVGVATVNCDGATCMQICEAGKIAMGRRRIKCRWKRKLGFFWKRALSECQGCAPENPISNDPNLTIDCAVNTKGFNVCLAKCTDGGTILGLKKLKLKCKCPRVNKTFSLPKIWIFQIIKLNIGLVLGWNKNMRLGWTKSILGCCSTFQFNL